MPLLGLVQFNVCSFKPPIDLLLKILWHNMLRFEVFNYSLWLLLVHSSWTHAFCCVSVMDTVSVKTAS